MSAKRQRGGFPFLQRDGRKGYLDTTVPITIRIHPTHKAALRVLAREESNTVSAMMRVELDALIQRALQVARAKGLRT